MLGAIAALALLPHLPHVPNPFAPVASFGSGPFGAGGRPGEVRKTDTQLPGGWRLSRTDDAFTSTTGCKLVRREVRVFSGVVTFSLGRGVDTANALYRLDGGPVRAAGELGPEVAGHGVSYMTGDTSNPSDGQVHVPWTTLAGARTVAIRADPGRPSRSFPLDSLAAAVAAARQGGCDDLV